MKRLISLSLAFLIIISVFSGCKANVLNLADGKTETSTVESTVTTETTILTTAEPEQTTNQKIAPTIRITEKQTETTEKQKAATTVAKTTTVPVQTTSKPKATTTTKATTSPVKTTAKPIQTTPKPGIQKDGAYTSKADVSLYIHTYNKLPNNFITKDEAEALGWQGGSVEPYAPGKCIGGDYFGNYEGLLEKANGREYTECDIDTLGAGSRGAKRIVFSNDGLIYYTSDHYASFTRLY